MEIPTEIVGKYDVMDPATEDLLSSGHDLRNGMIVLIGEMPERWSVVGEPDENQAYYIMLMNRWALISEVHHRSTPNGHKVVFVATYKDGTKIKRQHDINYSWLVKLDSMPKLPRHDAQEMDPSVGMQLLGQAHNPSVLANYDTGEIVEINGPGVAEDQTVYKNQPNQEG